MIDPTNMTEYGASKHRLEEIILFSLLAANNNAVTAAKGLVKFLTKLRGDIGANKRTGPFDTIKRWSEKQHGARPAVSRVLRNSGIGKFNRKAIGVIDLVYKGLDLHTCCQADLETVYNIGFKTSRFFILHTRPEANTVDNVALDTHMMSCLQDKGHDVPDNTPGTEKEYKRAAKLFFNHAKKSGKSLADFDLEIWLNYSGHRRRIAKKNRT